MKRIIIILAGFLLLTSLTLVGVAQATPPSNLKSTTLGRIHLGPFHESSHGFTISSRHPTDTVVLTTTINPGGSTGWHSHPGPAFIVVIRGTLTVYEVPRAFRTVHPLGWTIWKGEILPRAKKSFSPEFRDEAVKMVIETSRPIARVAKELGINEGTLGNWVGIYRREHAGEEPPLSVSERARLRELERETRELKMENEFLKKAAAYFARDHR
jgi:transposase